MSKLGCICGHTIVDQTDNIPYKAKFIRDEDAESSWTYSGDIAAFIKAIQQGERERWLAAYFSPAYPASISDDEIIFDIVSMHQRNLAGDIYQCTNCGRIKIQMGTSDVYASFKPEDGNYEDIFKGISGKRV